MQGKKYKLFLKLHSAAELIFPNNSFSPISEMGLNF